MVQGASKSLAKEKSFSNAIEFTMASTWNGNFLWQGRLRQWAELWGTWGALV